MEIVIMENAQQVAHRASDVIELYVRRGATLGLATGSTPLETYKELIRRHHATDLSFAECRAFLLDEYVGLPQGHPQGYRETIRREFTRHIDISDDQVHGPDASAEDVRAAALTYERQLLAAGGVDIQILGLGTDGHIGFNEPGSSLVSRTRLKTLHPQTVQDNARFFESPQQVPRHVLTQGLGTIVDAGHLLLLATGPTKSAALAALSEGPLSAACPASVLQWHPHVTVISDEPAAAEMKLRHYHRAVLAQKPPRQPH
ncbi:glucosamine-6-phosphate deaminase [Nesterenkonia haasae]|uniref:glucosamine-6-phosphate deaminase n=1 Tax=Nesterenkonia haasae TaxID=2587813 RepID=UPI001390C6AC|nr:glucosamine-6-phosphate deaminase [Nesterenkonia haasae]NDK31691.1 glucosamine-6-phosphate deaminase [Nesterenkonia haasae]